MTETDGITANAAYQALEFVLRDQHYAVDILSVAEVLPFQAPTPVFHSPAHVLGIMNLRGVVTALLDTAHFFDLSLGAVTTRTRILVMKSTESGVDQEAGFVVDEVVGARMIRTAELYPPPATVPASLREYISGVIEEKSGPLILLVAGKIFASEKVAGL